MKRSQQRNKARRRLKRARREQRARQSTLQWNADFLARAYGLRRREAAPALYTQVVALPQPVLDQLHADYLAGVEALAAQSFGLLLPREATLPGFEFIRPLEIRSVAEMKAFMGGVLRLDVP